MNLGIIGAGGLLRAVLGGLRVLVLPNEPTEYELQTKQIGFYEKKHCMYELGVFCVFPPFLRLRDVVGFCVCVSHQVKDPGSEITGIAPFYEL